MKHLIGLIFLTAISAATFAQEIRLNNSNAVESVSQPLVIIDGELMPKLVKSKTDSTHLVSPLSNLDNSQIHDMAIFKGFDLKAYGDACKDGVIIINTRKKSSY